MNRYLGLFDKEEMVAAFSLDDLGSLEWYGANGLELRNIEEEAYVRFSKEHPPKEREPVKE